MRTSLNDIKLIEGYLAKSLRPSESLMVQVRAIIDPDFKENIRLQRKVYRFLEVYHEEQLRQDIKVHHGHVFRDPMKATFKEKIINLFNGDHND
jgi:hypothetical protein